MEELRAIIRCGGRGLPFAVAAIVLLSLAAVLIGADVARAGPASLPALTDIQAERIQAGQDGPCAALLPTERAKCAARRAVRGAARHEVARRITREHTSLNAQWQRAIAHSKQPHLPGLSTRGFALIFGLVGCGLVVRRERRRWRAARRRRSMPSA